MSPDLRLSGALDALKARRQEHRAAVLARPFSAAAVKDAAEAVGRAEEAVERVLRTPIGARAALAKAHSGEEE